MRDKKVSFAQKDIKKQLGYLENVYEWLRLEENGPVVFKDTRRGKLFLSKHANLSWQDLEKALEPECQAAIGRLREEIKAFEKKMEAEPERYPLEAFCQANCLNAFERFVVTVTAAIAAFGRYGHHHLYEIGVRKVAGLFYGSPQKRLDAEFYFMGRCRLEELDIIHGEGPLELRRGRIGLSADLKIKEKAFAAVMGRPDLCIEDNEGPRDRTKHREEGPGSISVPGVGLSKVVLPAGVKEQILQAVTLSREEDLIFNRWGLGKQINKGKAASMLFAGPPGTGKTLAAEAVARELGKPLLAIKGSDVVSCWWGESEKNAERVFKYAEKEEAVLLFDEADSYFYRRHVGERSIDQSSNRLVNVFLSCIETYNLPVILTTNRADALDEALERRLSLKVEFPVPGPTDRARIWKLHLPKEMPLAKDVNVKGIAEEYPLTGGQIKNVVLAAARMAAYRITRTGGSGRISMADLEEACREEQAGSVVMGIAERVVGFTV